MQTLQTSHWLTGWKALGRLLVAVFGAWILVVTFAGCGGQPTNGKVHIQLSTWGSAQEVAVLKKLLQKFETAHPRIQVDLLHIPDNYYQKLQLLIAGDLTPDVMLTNSISFPIYASQGIFMDLQPLLSEKVSEKTGRDQASDSEFSEFYPQALQAFTWRMQTGKKILGALPRDISDVVIFYNRDLFKRAGLPEPASHWTWVQFLKATQTLTVDTNHDGDPDQFGFSFYAQPPLFWLPFVWSAGGDLFDANLQQVTLDQPAALEGLQFYANLRNQEHVAPKKVESGGITMSQLFLQQKIAMLISGRWSVPVLREQARFGWDVAPFPIGPGGHSRVGIDASGYAVSAKTVHPQESLALVRFLLSAEAIRAVTVSGLIVPARRDVAESKEFLTPGQAPAHSRVFLDCIKEGSPTHTPPRWNEFSEELGLALEPVWDGKQTAAVAIRQAKPRLQHLLEVNP